MNPESETLRNEVKKYIDAADEGLLKMVYELLETDISSDWRDTLPDQVKDDLNKSIAQADAGITLTHEEVIKKFPQRHLK